METRICFSGKSRFKREDKIAVKLIYGTGIGHYVMDGSELMESLLNSIKPLHGR
jgi:hypothetical protein